MGMAAAAGLTLLILGFHSSEPKFRRPYGMASLCGQQAHGARRTAAATTFCARARAPTMDAQGNGSAPSNRAARGQTYEWSIDRDVAPADKLWMFKKALQLNNFLGLRTRESVPDPAGQLRPLVQALVLSALGLALGVSLFFAFSRDLVPQAYVEAVTTATRDR